MAGMLNAHLLDRLRIAIAWLAEGRRVAMATLIATEGSAPLPPGALMLIDDRCRIEGSITGGCVEGALADEAVRLLSGGEARLLTYGITDSQAMNVGLMCGGTVRVLLSEITDVSPLKQIVSSAEAGEPVALATVLDGPDAGAQMAIGGSACTGTLGPDLLDRNIRREGRGYLAKGHSAVRRYGREGQTIGDDISVWIQSFASQPKMIIFGATDFSAALAKTAATVGYAVTIVDARPAFLEAHRYSEHAQTVVAWPQAFLKGTQLGPRDAVLVFTHDPKFDEPALLGTLATEAGYIGALGSRRAALERNARLLEAGASTADIRRIHAPCGLDIGARTPSETALSILAEIIAAGTGRTGGPLQESEEPIHPRAEERAPA